MITYQRTKVKVREYFTQGKFNIDRDISSANDLQRRDDSENFKRLFTILLVFCARCRMILGRNLLQCRYAIFTWSNGVDNKSSLNRIGKSFILIAILIHFQVCTFSRQFNFFLIIPPHKSLYYFFLFQIKFYFASNK